MVRFETMEESIVYQNLIANGQHYAQPLLTPSKTHDEKLK
jgi:hypothetical protein